MNQGAAEQGSGGTAASIRVLRTLSARFRSPWPVLWLLAITMVLGYWGFSEIEGETISASDKAYRSFQLLYLDSDVPDDGTPWQLDVARFIAPLVIPYAALVALLSAVGGRAERMRMRLLGRRHVLVVGAGDRGAMLARALERDGYNVIVLELDEANGVALSLRRSGIPVVFGDARDSETLEVVRPHRAAQIVLLAGDDSVNLEILGRLRPLLEVGGDPVPVHVAIDGTVLWAELHRLPFTDADVQKQVEFVNLPDRVARLLTDVAYPGDAEGVPDRRIVVHGDGPEISRTVVQALRSPAVGEDPTVVLEGPGAEEALTTLRATDDWVITDRASKVSLGDGVEELDDVTESFVCGLPEADALSAAASLRRRTSNDSPIYISMPDDDTELALESIGVDLTRYRMVATMSRVLSEDLFTQASIERIARGRHEAYVRGALSRGEDPAKKRAIAPWDEIGPDLQRANREFADDIRNLLTVIGAKLAPLTGEEVGSSLPLSPMAREYLGIREHNRWWEDKCRQGMRWGTLRPEESNNQTHPSMVPWDWLTDNDKMHDLDAIDELPGLLAEIGYTIVPPTEAEVDAAIEKLGGIEAARAQHPKSPDCNPDPAAKPDWAD